MVEKVVSGPNPAIEPMSGNNTHLMNRMPVIFKWKCGWDEIVGGIKV
ncbi:MAG: hypothetical protein ACXQT2_06550 [Methanotrichaceae archaeon]